MKSAYDTALSEYNDAVIAFNAAKATYEKDTSDLNNKKAMDAAEIAMKSANEKLKNCKGNLDKVQGPYDSAKSAATDSKNALSNANYNLSVKKLTGTNTAEANNLQAQDVYKRQEKT